MKSIRYILGVERLEDEQVLRYRYPNWSGMKATGHPLSLLRFAGQILRIAVTASSTSLTSSHIPVRQCSTSITNHAHHPGADFHGYLMRVSFCDYWTHHFWHIGSKIPGPILGMLKNRSQVEAHLGARHPSNDGRVFERCKVRPLAVSP